MNLKHYLLTLLCLFPYAVTAAPTTQDLPGNQYALILQDRIHKCDLWLNAVNTVFDKEKLDKTFLQRWTDWQRRAKTKVTSTPTSPKDREAWVSSLHALFKEHEKLTKATPKLTETFPISIRGLVKNPKTIEIKKGTTVKQAVEMAGGLSRYASFDFFALYRSGSGSIQITRHPLNKPVQLLPGDMIVFIETFLLEQMMMVGRGPFDNKPEEYKTPVFPIKVTNIHDIEKSQLYKLLTMIPPSPRPNKQSAKMIKTALSILEKNPNYYPTYENLGYDFAMDAAKTLYKNLYKDEYKLQPFIVNYLTKVAEKPATSELQLRHILNFLTLNNNSSQQSVLKIFKKRFPNHWSIPVYQVIHEQSQ